MAPVSQAQTPEDFGYASLTPALRGRVPATGTRDLLTILIEFGDTRFAAEHTPTFYRRLLFDGAAHIAGPGGYFDEISHGRFDWRNAGVVGPYTHGDDPGTPARNESRFECAYGITPGCGGSGPSVVAEAIHLADRDVDFTAFDHNDNGVVTFDELAVQVIAAWPEGENLTTTTTPQSPPWTLTRTEGWVFPPPPGAPPYAAPPSGRRALFRWTDTFTGLRGDHVTTTDPGWVPASPTDTRTPSYNFLMHEGFVLTRRAPGTVPLYTWFSPSRGDNFTTSHPSWRPSSRTDTRRAPDYELVRREGWVFDPSQPQPAGTVPLFGFFTDADSGITAGTRAIGGGCGRGDGLFICLLVPGLGQGAGAMNYAHELIHVLQGSSFWEAYGAGARLNTFFSLMGATLMLPRDERRSYHLDAYAKMRLGWVRPGILTTDTRGCFALRAAELRSVAGVRRPGDPLTRSAFLIWDPARGPGEFFLLEHRRPLPSNYDGNPWGAPSSVWTGLPDVGLAIWHAAVNAQGNLITVPALDASGGQDPGLFLVPPGSTPGSIGTLGNPAGFQGLWSSADGTAGPTWLDGSSSGFSVRVVSRSVGGARIVLSLGGAACEDTRPSPSPAGPRVVPGLDDGPCAREAGAAIRCRFAAADYVAIRRTRSSLRPGSRARVRWTLTPRRRLDRVRIDELLPAGITVPRVQGDTRRVARLAFSNLRVGRRVAGSYAVLTDRGAAPGRFGVRTVIRHRRHSGRRTFARVLRTAVAVWSRARWWRLETPLGSVVFEPTPPSIAQPPPPPPPGPPLPDLAIADLEPFKVTVVNQGAATAGAFTVAVTGIGKLPVPNGLPAGGMTTLTWQTCVPGTITATADPDDAVAESSEFNNSASVENLC